MELSLAFMGTGASVPSARRNTAGILVSRGGEQMLFDCGEGTQRQMQRSVGLVSLDRIFLTHYHADHVLGLPGLIKTYGLMDRVEPLEILGPPGLHAFFSSLDPLIGRTQFDLDLIELEPGDTEVFGSRDGDEYEIRAFGVKHRVPCNGYALVEPDRPGRFDPVEAQMLGISPGPDFRRLQLGETVTGSAGPVRPEQVMGESRSGRTVVISGDTAPCMATMEAAADADLLIHEATFMEEDKARAALTGHSTAAQAAALARDAAVQSLALVHISARYHIGRVLDEARAEFDAVVAPRDFDLITVPFAERGKPELINDGARRREGNENPA